MKKIYLTVAAMIAVLFLRAQTICDPNGNVVLYSNYDGGVLNINCDVNIPNLKIGVVSYEMVTINLTGPFVNNITEVRFAGYTTTTHMHCPNTPPVTSIVGAPAGTDTIIFMPPSPVSNPNGYGIIICNASCDSSTNQGGCNTPDQVAAYFQQAFGGSLRYHYTQYGCWNNTYDMSAGGNCCIGGVISSPVPVAYFQSSDTVFCAKQCIDFTDLSSNNPIAWQWYFPGADSTSSNSQNPTGICYSSYGTFDVTLIACNLNGCDTFTVTNFIQEYQLPATPVITANFDTLFSSLAFSYQWYDTSGAIAGATNQYYVFTQQGTYYVVITDSNGCAASSIALNTGIADHKTQQFLIYPNPSDGHFIVNIPDTYEPDANIFDIYGRLISGLHCRPGRNDIRFDLGNGVYFLQFTNGKDFVHKKFVISR